MITITREREREREHECFAPVRGTELRGHTVPITAAAIVAEALSAKPAAELDQGVER
jgi:hypothetical protein